MGQRRFLHQTFTASSLDGFAEIRLRMTSTIWWNLFVEGVSVGLGYRTYFDTFGPSIVFASTAISLVHPLIIFTIYGVVAAYILSDRDDNGHARFESVFRVKSVRPGWRRESVRLLAYVVVMNLTFFVFMSIPMIVVRELFGHANAFVP